MNAIETHGLAKRYGEKIAVDTLNLTVREGELFALLGVNGAGKTTTVRMLTCLSEPTEGDCLVCGFHCRSEQEKVKNIIGISPQDTAVAENLTVSENLRLICGIYGFSSDKVQQKTEDIIKSFHMEEVRNVCAKTLSGGWKRKLSIAMALISEPKVLFLDEPTLGLDVLARRELWNVIENLKGKITIVLTTHYMEEAEKLCDRIAILLSGKIRAMGTVEQLEKIYNAKGLEEVFVAAAEQSRKETDK